MPGSTFYLPRVPLLHKIVLVKTTGASRDFSEVTVSEEGKVITQRVALATAAGLSDKPTPNLMNWLA